MKKNCLNSMDCKTDQFICVRAIRPTRSLEALLAKHNLAYFQHNENNGWNRKDDNAGHDGRQEENMSPLNKI